MDNEKSLKLHKFLAANSLSCLPFSTSGWHFAQISYTSTQKPSLSATNPEINIVTPTWGAEQVNRQVVRELIEQKGPKVRQELPDGEAWSFHYAVFARDGFTAAAAAELSVREGLLVDLALLDEVLSD